MLIISHIWDLKLNNKIIIYSYKYLIDKHYKYDN